MYSEEKINKNLQEWKKTMGMDRNQIKDKEAGKCRGCIRLNTIDYLKIAQLAMGEAKTEESVCSEQRKK